MSTKTDRAMEEVASQRELFWYAQERTLKRLPKPAREAVKCGEALLRDAQRRKIEAPAPSAVPTRRKKKLPGSGSRRASD